MKRDLAKKIIFLFAVFIILLFVFIKAVYKKFYLNLIQEDSIIEYAQSIIYFFCFILALRHSVSFYKKGYSRYGLFYLILSFCFIFISGEEISWGQRILSINIPVYFKEHNLQQELTLHNLGIIMHCLFYGAYAIVGFAGAFAWMLFCIKKIRTIPGIKYVIPEWFLMFYFLPVFIVYSVYCFYGFSIICFGKKPFCLDGGYFILWKDQEPAELLLAFGFLIFLIYNKNNIDNVCPRRLR